MSIFLNGFMASCQGVDAEADPEERIDRRGTGDPIRRRELHAHDRGLAKVEPDLVWHSCRLRQGHERGADGEEEDQDGHSEVAGMKMELISLVSEWKNAGYYESGTFDKALARQNGRR